MKTYAIDTETYYDKNVSTKNLGAEADQDAGADSGRFSPDLPLKAYYSAAQQGDADLNPELMHKGV